jgi:hypothetical protein
MKTSRRTRHSRSPIPPDAAEVAMASVGWRRVGLLQRLVKVERARDLVAADDRIARSEHSQRQAA